MKRRTEVLAARVEDGEGRPWLARIGGRWQVSEGRDALRPVATLLDVATSPDALGTE
ncbi:MAG: hypothetical protein M5U31_00420 [Acidimicrobiia bacterium]|nr:hypothetical protein [Acidimicrobiia bacterium]